MIRMSFYISSSFFCSIDFGFGFYCRSSSSLSSSFSSSLPFSDFIVKYLVMLSWLIWRWKSHSLKLLIVFYLLNVDRSWNVCDPCITVLLFRLNFFLNCLKFETDFRSGEALRFLISFLYICLLSLRCFTSAFSNSCLTFILLGFFGSASPLLDTGDTGDCFTLSRDVIYSFLVI